MADEKKDAERLAKLKRAAEKTAEAYAVQVAEYGILMRGEVMPAAVKENGAGKSLLANKVHVRKPQPEWLPERWGIIEPYLMECVAAGVPEPDLHSIYQPLDRSGVYKWLKGESKPSVEKTIRRVCEIDKPHLKRPQK